jgi:hypothetical protein
MEAKWKVFPLFPSHFAFTRHIFQNEVIPLENKVAVFW